MPCYSYHVVVLERSRSFIRYHEVSDNWGTIEGIIQIKWGDNPINTFLSKTLTIYKKELLFKAALVYLFA